MNAFLLSAILALELVMQFVKFERVDTICNAGLLPVISRLLGSRDELLSKDAALCFISVLHHDAAHRYLMNDSTEHSRDIIDQLMRCAMSCATNTRIRLRSRAKNTENIIRTITRLASNTPLRRYMLSRSLELAREASRTRERCHSSAHALPPRQNVVACVIDVVYECLALSGGSGRPMHPVKKGESNGLPSGLQNLETRASDGNGERGDGIQAAPAYLAPELFLDVMRLVSELTQVAPG